MTRKKCSIARYLWQSSVEIWSIRHPFCTLLKTTKEGKSGPWTWTRSDICGGHSLRTDKYISGTLFLNKLYHSVDLSTESKAARMSKNAPTVGLWKVERWSNISRERSKTRIFVLSIFTMFCSSFLAYAEVIWIFVRKIRNSIWTCLFFTWLDNSTCDWSFRTSSPIISALCKQEYS